MIGPSRILTSMSFSPASFGCPLWGFFEFRFFVLLLTPRLVLLTGRYGIKSSSKDQGNQSSIHLGAQLFDQFETSKSEISRCEIVRDVRLGPTSNEIIRGEGGGLVRRPQQVLITTER
jgi:hypothetical protein